MEDLHNKICRDHFAWFEKEIASDYGNAPNEATVPMTPEEETIFNYKMKNQLSITSKLTIEDIYYEEGATTREQYLRRVNAFCELKQSNQSRKVGGITFRIIDGEKILC